MKFFRVISQEFSGPETYTRYEKFFLSKENALKALEDIFEKEIEAKREYGFEFEILENEKERKLIKDKWGDQTIILLEELQTED